jgi:hypothetical protein
METVANPAYGRPMGFDPVSGLTAGQQGDQAYKDALLAADETAAATQADQWQSQFDASTLGQDTQRWIQDENGALIENPMYGMTPAQQADYSMDLWTMTQTEPQETTVTGRLMNYLAQLGDPAFTSAVLTTMIGVINDSPSLMSKGLSEENVLFALGQLSDTTEDGGKTYPYRDMFFAVQQGAGEGSTETAPGLDGFVPPGAIGTGDENLTAVADAAAAAGGSGPTFIPGGGEFGIDTTVAPVPAGQQPGNASQRAEYYDAGAEIAFYLNDGRPMYADGDGKHYFVTSKAEKYVAEGDKALEYSYRWVPQRHYKGEGWRWPADQMWPDPLSQG